MQVMQTAVYCQTFPFSKLLPLMRVLIRNAMQQCIISYSKINWAFHFYKLSCGHSGL